MNMMAAMSISAMTIIMTLPNENAGIEVVAPAWKVVFDASVECNINYGRTQRAVLDREYLTLPEGMTMQDFSGDLEKDQRKDADKDQSYRFLQQ